VLRALRPTLLLLIVLAACAALVAGCGSKDKGSASTDTTQADTSSTKADTTTTPADTGTTATTDAGGCQKVAKPAPKAQPHLPKPALALDPSKTWTATVKTNCGTFTIVLDVKRAPKTSSSFASLAKKGFFDNLIFHRIVPGFVIQGGDPLGNGTGGPGYRVVEAPPKKLQYTHGIVSMAKAGNEPDGASGSQFFVVLGDNVGLPPEYALVGKVSKGLDVVDTIGAVPLDPNGDGSTSTDPVVIQSVKVASR
jgi:cyclophilin family peptidyl-prolyl cis-trans isomerase